MILTYCVFDKKKKEEEDGKSWSDELHFGKMLINQEEAEKIQKGVTLINYSEPSSPLPLKRKLKRKKVIFVNQIRPISFCF